MHTKTLFTVPSYTVVKSVWTVRDLYESYVFVQIVVCMYPYNATQFSYTRLPLKINVHYHCNPWMEPNGLSRYFATRLLKQSSHMLWCWLQQFNATIYRRAAGFFSQGVACNVSRRMKTHFDTFYSANNPRTIDVKMARFPVSESCLWQVQTRICFPAV